MILAALWIAAALFALTASAGPRTQQLEALIDQAEVVAAVTILSTDYRATAADGSMYADAKLLKVIKGELSTGISVLAIPRWSGYSDPRLGCKVFVFLSRSMLRSLPFGSLNAARSPRSSSLEGFSPTRLRVVPSSATQRLFSVAAVARYPPGTGSAQIRPSISANSLRLRCPSANSSQ